MKHLMNLLAAALLLTGTAMAQDIQIKNVTLSQDQVVGGQTVEGKVWLDQPAPAQGFEVELWVDDTADVPTRVVIPAGQTQVKFSVSTSKVTHNQSINVAALSPESSAHRGLEVTPDLRVGQNR